jgi:hypothetical protein
MSTAAIIRHVEGCPCSAVQGEAVGMGVVVSGAAGGGGGFGKSTLRL